MNTSKSWERGRARNTLSKLTLSNKQKHQQQRTWRRTVVHVKHLLKAKKHCTRCGGEPHPWKSCPAKEATCYSCHRKGHYSSECLTKTKKVFSVQTAEPTVQAAELPALDEAFYTVVADSENSWTAKVQVGSQYLTFKLDTGAEVKAITEDAYSSLQGVPLQKHSKILYGPGHKPLTVLREFTQKLHCRDWTTNQKIFVVKCLGRNLLGLPAISALNLIATVDTVQDYTHM